MGKKEHFFPSPSSKWKQKLGAVLCCKLTPWLLSTFQWIKLTITWWFAGSFFPSSTLPVCVGEAPLGWAGLAGPFLLWERREERKPPRDWRECAVLLWLQVISLNKIKKKQWTGRGSTDRQPWSEMTQQEQCCCLNLWRTHLPSQAHGALYTKKLFQKYPVLVSKADHYKSLESTLLGSVIDMVGPAVAKSHVWSP